MIQERRTSKGQARYRVRVHFAGQIVATRTFTRKGDAQSWERDQLRRLERGQGMLDITAGKKPLSWWSERYLAAWHGGAPESYTRTESLLRVHVVPEFGRTPVSAISRAAVRGWVSELSKRRSPNTVRLALSALRWVLDFAVEAEALEANVAKGVAVHGVRPGVVRALTHQQVRLLAEEVISTRDRAFVYLLAYCGLRFGEAVALTWSDFKVTDDGLVVSVMKAVRHGAERRRELGPTKTLSTRLVPVPRVAREALVRLWDERAETTSEGVWPEAACTDGSVVFSTRTGRPVALQSMHTALGKACRRAGIDPVVTPHQLRDTYASLAIASGASVAAVAANLGHSMVMTLRHYASVIPEERTRIALRLEQASEHSAGSAGRDDIHTTDVPEDSGG